MHELRVSGTETPPNDVDELLAAFLFPWEAESERTLNPAQVAELDACKAAVRDGRRILLEIEAVFGATVLLLAESVEWLDPFPD